MVILLRKRAKNNYFAELDELSKLSWVDHANLIEGMEGIGAQSINIYVGYIQADFGTQSMKYKPKYLNN